MLPRITGCGAADDGRPIIAILRRIPNGGAVRGPQTVSPFATWRLLVSNR